MDNTRQQIIVRWLLRASVFFIVVLNLGIGYGCNTLTENQRMVSHTNDVEREIDIAKNEYRAANHTGINRNISGVANIGLESARMKSLDGVTRLKTIVSDNEEQVNNLVELEDTIKKRFESQDEQFATQTRKDKEITYQLDISAKSSQYAEKVETIFLTLKFNEGNLLRTERQPALAKTQWAIVYGLWFSAFIALGILIYISVKYGRTLSQNIQIDKTISDIPAENIVGKDEVKIKKSTLEFVQKLARGET